jgi:FMN phosphatase YigB (HAD superfamily)
MFEIERDPMIQITNERLRHLGIKAVFFDLDDTLVFTSALFVKNMHSFSEALSLKIDTDSDTIYHLLDKINNEEHLKNGANPDNWNTIICRLGEQLNCPQEAQSLRFHIDAIYTKEPRLIPGARQVLSGLQSGGLLLGQVTWGKLGWSQRKNDQAGITSFFDVIVSADIHRSKNESDWQKAMNSLSVAPQESLVIGDNLKGDIIPAINLGARAIALTSPWSIFREGDAPKGVINADKISGFFDAVQKLQ